MHQKIHMQDQITNRIEIIMGEQHNNLKQVMNDLATIILFITILAVSVVW